MSHQQGPQRLLHPPLLPLLLGLVVFLTLVVFPYLVAIASDDGFEAPMPAQMAKKMPLDLPSGGHFSPDFGPPPEDVDVFGTTIRGNSFYVLVEHSLTMFGERAEKASAEFNNLIWHLSSEALFGAVTFGGYGASPFRTGPVMADGGYKALAVDWENLFPQVGEGSIAEGIVEVLRIAHIDSGPNRRVILILDETFAEGEDADTLLDTVVAFNWDRLPIHCYFIHDGDPDPDAEGAAQAISEYSGGTFKPIVIPLSEPPH